MLKIDDFEKHNYVISMIEIINKINQFDPHIKINPLSDSHIIVEYIPIIKKENKLFKLCKIGFLTLVLFGGAATTIMAFHNETALPEVFDTYFKMFFGYESKNPAFIDIPYSIGLATGIILFFNHVFGKKFSNDPTPIEIEMNKYEKDLSTAEKDIITGEKNGKS